MFNRKYEDYLLNFTWFSRTDIEEYKVYYLKTDGFYYVGFTGLLDLLGVLLPDGYKKLEEYPVLLYKGNYNSVKKVYLDILESGLLNENRLCDIDGINKIKNIMQEVYEE